MKYKIVTPTTVGIVPTLESALAFSLSRRNSEKAGIYIYFLNEPTEN